MNMSYFYYYNNKGYFYESGIMSYFNENNMGFFFPAANVDGQIVFSGKFYEKNKKKFVKLDPNPRVSIKLGNSKMHFDNLFNGNADLGKFKVLIKLGYS